VPWLLEGEALAKAPHVATNVKSVSPPLAAGMLRRSHTGCPCLQVRFKDPRAEADPMGCELPLPDSPVDGALAGLERFRHLNCKEQTPQPAHNRLGPPWRAIPITTHEDHRRGRSPVAQG
jgi:hypothetical protein